MTKLLATEEIRPKFTLINGNSVVETQDIPSFEIVYKNNVNPGIATIMVSHPLYSDSMREFTFKIVDRTVKQVTMYRLYNPNSSEHFYTSSAREKNYLVSVGWKDEGTGWIAPASSNTPVYRLYNANAGDHHYTVSKNERDYLIKAGWKDEGIGWYSADDSGIPLYRQYNPNAKAGSHNYTANSNENDYLVSVGWKSEGIAWYGLK